MRLVPLTLLSIAVVPAFVLMGCSGGNNKKGSSASATAGTFFAGSPVSGNQTPSPEGTPFAGTTSACATLVSGPGAPTPTTAAAPITPEPPFVAGTQPTRPNIDLNEFTVNPQHIPSGFTSAEAGRSTPVRLTAADLAQTTANPQATVAHLNNIGFLGGRQQAWGGPTTQGRIPSIYVDHLVFVTDAGASNFIHSPAFSATICVKPETGAQIGQESAHVFYQFTIPLATGGNGPAEGHGVYWRCGRVDIVVTAAGAPAQFSEGQVDDLVRKIQNDFVKKQPCS